MWTRGRSVKGRRTPGGWVWGGRGKPPWKERGKGAGKEGVAGTGWVGRGGGVRRGTGGVCPGLLSCHPHPRPGATCAPPYRPHPNWGTKKPAVWVSCAPRGSSRVLPLPGRLSWIRKCGLSESPPTERVCSANSRVGSWSVVRQDDQPGGHTEPGN